MTPEEAQGHARWALEYALENDETYLEPETVDDLREALAVLTPPDHDPEPKGLY